MFGLSGEAGISSSTTNRKGTQTTQKILSQEGIDKLLYDVMSSDQGLAALATAENASGGFRSSSKTLLAQDLIAKVMGELANITAPTVVTEDVTEKTTGKSAKAGGKAGSVICTEVMEKGYVSRDLYCVASQHFEHLNPLVVRGYHFWAIPFVAKFMKTSKTQKIHRVFLPWVLGRYDWYLKGQKNWRGGLTIFVGHPICWTIGALLTLVEKVNGGRASSVNVSA